MYLNMIWTLVMHPFLSPRDRQACFELGAVSGPRVIALKLSRVEAIIIMTRSSHMDPGGQMCTVTKAVLHQCWNTTAPCLGDLQL